MFSDDELMSRLVLKGGNALDLIHRVGARASVDIDLSMESDFALRSEREFKIALRGHCVKRSALKAIKSLTSDFRSSLRGLTADLADFWGGYSVEFKLIEINRYEEFKADVNALRRNAVQLGQGPKFSIDISKHEYTTGKAQLDLDGFAIFVYTRRGCRW